MEHAEDAEDAARLDALGCVEMTIYCNEDNPAGTLWTNAEVLELLAEIAERLCVDGSGDSVRSEQ